MRRLHLTLAVAAALAVGASSAGAAGAKAAAEPASEYGRDLISVVNGRQQAPPTGNCIVWANAEGLGVGPAQLNGMHGVSMNINVRPAPNDSVPATSFESGVSALKAAYPTTPAWILDALQKHRAAIEAACGVDHATPFKVYAFTAADRH